MSDTEEPHTRSAISTVNKNNKNFVPVLFHNLLSYDCHLEFEQLLTKALELEIIGIRKKLLPKSLESYISVQLGCLRFLDPYSILSDSLHKLVESKG